MRAPLQSRDSPLALDIAKGNDSEVGTAEILVNLEALPIVAHLAAPGFLYTHVGGTFRYSHTEF